MKNYKRERERFRVRGNRGSGGGFVWFEKRKSEGGMRKLFNLKICWESNSIMIVVILGEWGY